MPALELTPEDQLMMAEIRRNMRDEAEAAADPVSSPRDGSYSRSDLRRPPGFSGDRAAFEMPATPLGKQLADDAGFQAFTKSILTRSSSYACELRVPPSRKAAISGLSPTEYIPTKIWGTAMFPLRLKEIMPVMPVGSGSVEYTVETAYTPGAAVVPETTLKPAMANTFAEATAKCSTIADTVKVSKQSLMDVALMNQWLSLRLSYSVALKEENVILNGDATNGIQGLMQLATPYAVAPLSTDNAMDTIARAAGALMAKGYAVDGVVMNADDYTSARLLKSTVGTYLFMGTAATGPDDESIWESTPLIWQVPMVMSPAMPAGSFLVGSFATSTILFSREVLTVEIAFQNEDDFIRNLICMRGELRSGVAVPVPAGILKGTLPAGSTQAVGGSISGPNPIGKK